MPGSIQGFGRFPKIRTARLKRDRSEWTNIIIITGILILMIFLNATFALSSHHTSSKKKYVNEWCQTEGYHCVRVKSGQSWEKLFPDDKERGIVMRVNRMNGELYPGLVLKVPDDLESSNLLSYSPFPLQVEPTHEKVIIVDLSQNAWGAYDPNGLLVRWGAATGGAGWCKDIKKSCRTKAGSFRIYSLGSSNCVSTKFPVPRGGAPMPYCMFFNGGQALHGSPGAVVRGNVSHGCVRLFVSDAEWLRYDFVEGPNSMNNYRGTRVEVLPY